MIAGAAAPAVERTLARKLAGVHWPLVALLLVLGLVGYATLYSAAGGAHGPWAWKHGVRLAVFLPAMVAMALVDLRLWLRLSYAAFGAALLLLLAVDALGEISKGAQRWLDLGVVQLQPSELMKVALVMALARYFHGARPEDARRTLFLAPALAMILAPVGLVLVQPDLGTAATLLVIGAAVLFLAGVPVWKFLAVGAAGAAALPVLWANLRDYQRQRVLTFLDPEADPLGAGYHIIQSKIALGSGGFWGKGFLRGTQSQLSFLPEKQTDFAFTMLAEELGFLGAALVLGLFLAVLLLGLAIAVRARSPFGRLVAAGAVVNLFVYVAINVAMVTGLIPVVGVPLPLISYGGTAMLTLAISLGLLLCADVHRDLVIPRHADAR